MYLWTSYRMQNFVTFKLSHLSLYDTSFVALTLQPSTSTSQSFLFFSSLILATLPPKLVNTLLLLRTLHSANFNIKFLWAPTHVCFVDNEYADNLARSTYLSLYSGVPVWSYSDYFPLLSVAVKNIWNSRWRNTLPAFAAF